LGVAGTGSRVSWIASTRSAAWSAALKAREIQGR
jgi:hypothetical protein